MVGSIWETEPPTRRLGTLYETPVIATKDGNNAAENASCPENTGINETLQKASILKKGPYMRSTSLLIPLEHRVHARDAAQNPQVGGGLKRWKRANSTPNIFQLGSGGFSLRRRLGCHKIRFPKDLIPPPSVLHQSYVNLTQIREKGPFDFRRPSRSGLGVLINGVSALLGAGKKKSEGEASFADDGSGPRELNPRAVRRTHSDVGGVTGRGSLHYSRQLSTPQPIKLRPAHRLPQHTGSLGKSKSLKRSKASSHLRRSISQPLDLDKAYDTPISTLRKCRSPTSTQNRRQRRPSAGNILNDDNTTSEDEIGMSDSEDFRTDLKRSLEEDEDMIVYAEALWDHVTLDSEELVFKAGDLITVIDSSDRDWWWGRICHRAGWFPAAFVRLLVNQEDHQETSSHDTRTSGPARKQSISGLSNDQIRTNVINEIISTERDFVKHLRDVVEGYLRQVRKRPDMFNDEKISSIFGNMEALYQFQSNFLKELEMCIDWKDPHKSCIGAAFIRNREKFEIYSEYCNNHPSAVSSLQELYQDQKYIHFFEACRLLQEMIDISLDGFLLTPVQKICKYPLQLQELLKYTKADHPDFASVQGALEAMRDVALLVNERKRRMECLEKIASWQITVEGWEGPELLEDSSQLIYQGDVTKGVGGSWTKEVSLFLFDHQLVYCKRDLLKRNTFVYRGRLNLDMCEIVDLPDGKDSSLNINAHNSWKIRSLEKNKWYVFSCKMASEKHKWMEAFRRERDLVAADESAGFVVAEKAKHLAKVAARNQRNRPKRPRSLWFSFGGHKKGRGSGRTLSQIQHHPV